MANEEIRPIGYMKTTKTGKSHVPALIRQEVGIEGKGEIPYFLDANVVLLVRKGAKRDDVLRGLDILKEDLRLRWREEEP